jgi:O-antigen ligase
MRRDVTETVADELPWGGVSLAPESTRSSTAFTRALLALFAFGVAVDAMPLFGFETTAMLFGTVLLVAATWHVIRTGRVRNASATLLILTCFVAWSGLSMLWARDLPTAQDRMTTNLQLVASTWLLWQIAREERDLRTIMVGYLAGCTFAIGGAWHSFLTGLTYLDHEERRFVALGFDPNDMGVTLAIGIPMAASLALTSTARLRYLWFVYVPLALSGIALSGSRGAAFAAGVAILWILPLVGRRSVPAMLVAIAVAAAGGVAVVSLTPESWERILGARQQLAGGTLSQRLPIWHAGLEVIAHHPIVGVGVGSFTQAVRPYLGYGIVAHNTIISVLAEGGAIGLLLFYGAIASVAYLVVQRAAPHRGLVLSLLVVWFVGTSSLSWEYRKTTWLLLLIGAAAARLRQPETRADPA